MPVYYVPCILRVPFHLWTPQFCHTQCRLSWEKSGREHHEGLQPQSEAWKGAAPRGFSSPDHLSPVPRALPNSDKRRTARK